MQLVESAIEDTVRVIEQEHQIDWSQMLDLIHLTNMEKVSNLNIRMLPIFPAEFVCTRNILPIQRLVSVDFEHCNLKPNERVLEIGCGNGALWTENLNHIPSNLSILLSDVSDGMLRDARRNLPSGDKRFSFACFDCHSFPSSLSAFDLIIANHVLFYCNDLPKVFKQIQRSLKKAAIFSAVPMESAT